MTYCNEGLHHKIHKVTKSTEKIFYYIFVLSQVSKYKAKNIRNCFVHPRQVTSPPMIKYKTKRLKNKQEKRKRIKKSYFKTQLYGDRKKQYVSIFSIA